LMRHSVAASTARVLRALGRRCAPRQEARVVA
jgi:hypothetical protein